MTLDEMQKWFELFAKKEGWLEHKSFVDIGFLLEEAGEVAREVRRHEIGRHAHVDENGMSNNEMKEKLAEEIGDTLQALSVIASRYDISLAEAFNIHKEKVIREYGDM